jgi:hypothetical protein
MQFDSTIHTWHTCKGSGRQNSTNPCSEYLFLNDTACNLASLNLVRFQKADGSFDADRFKAAVRLFIVAQDILVLAVISADHGADGLLADRQSLGDQSPVVLLAADRGSALAIAGAQARASLGYLMHLGQG